MIRKKITYELKENLSVSNPFYWTVVYIPNYTAIYPIYDYTNLVGATRELTITNYLNAYIEVLRSANMLNIVRLTQEGNKLIIDYPSEGTWAGYDDGYLHDPQYIVFQNEIPYLMNFYSDLENTYIKLSTTTYDDNTNATPEYLGIIGFDSKSYLINNDVYAKIMPEYQGNSVYVDISCTDMQTQKSVTSRIYYMNNNTLTIDLAIMVKSLMPPPKANFDYNNLQPYPINTNYGKYKFSFQRYFYPLNSEVLTFGSSVEIVKDMYRAGVYAQGSNFSMVYNKLRSVEKLPIWSGYPTAEYTLGANGEIIQNNDLTTVVDKEYRTTDTCNNYYLKFLNQKGGYSYWMFNNQKEDITANNVGYSDVYGLITDFGSNITATFEVSGKIPLDYKALIFDLISSSETYLYQGQNKWAKVVQKSNKLTESTDKRTFDVTFKFELINNFNPTI